MRKYIKFFALALLAILILWFFGRSLDWAEVWVSLKKADPLMIAVAVGIISTGYLLRAVRWKTLLAPITPASLRELFATTTVGFAAVFLFGRAGEVVRPLWLPLRDKRVRPSAALVTIGIERICDLLVIALVFSINLLWFRAPAGREAEFVVFNRAGLILLSLTIFGVICLAIFQYFAPAIIKIVENITVKLALPKRLANIPANLLTHLSASLNILRDPKELALTVFWTAALWFAISVPTWLVIRAFGLDFSFTDALFIMGVASLGSLVPTPGGAAGAFHAATAGGLIILGVNREDAAAVSIVMHLVYFSPALFFGFYYFIHGDISWARLRSLVIADENAPKAQLKIQNEKLKIEENELSHSTAQ